MRKGLLPIEEIARKLGIADAYFEPIGHYGAKLKLELLEDAGFPRRGKLILVTATTPTASGEGKTVTSIGLTQGLERIGKKAVITSREPSLGPIFGMKGGAAGGGRAQIEPSQKINLHFHGDFHAVTTAHNLLAALIDAHLYHGNELGLDPERISWPRTLDMNDRALRHIAVSVGGKKEGAGRHTGFVIAAASEVMAILALAKSREDLRRRLEAIVVGVSRSGKRVSARDLGATGAMLALLNDALLPNLVQTSEGTPALVHAGPFGNIAHGTSSVISHEMGLRLADYVVNEAGFAADLGAEKYVDIVMRASGIAPAVAVLVTSVQSLRLQGQGDLERGFANLGKHVEILRRLGLPIVAAINHFPKDTTGELERIAGYCGELGVASARSEAFAKGGLGAVELAEKVVETIAKNPSVTPRPIYALEEGLTEKIEKVAREVYGASGVSYSEEAERKLRQFGEWGCAGLPICVAKTQYSISDNPKLFGAPRDWMLHVSDAALSAGAGFVVVLAGNIMLMPGLPKVSRAAQIDVSSAGEILGV
ncbi:MAG: formate--tetrahydrofolate ligase [Acidobacteriia bacterium]|nr:formate--tetrahydrofolate ligase [Terriglobia bacterium]